ncbi:hypothetical protein SAMN05444392_102412 [Seinonella peptonophila]|uniref:Uncharacterized protein n=1 Tax=Seinonella peptonophila TaxID=112248 RepID=A0A1M4VLD0_9BACL|nr:hypothetical protein [Seinonella peptonophila]SHE69632.1 hypothetical protein SAMN05444392_102412 [Seinonella peptonophila]
MSVNPHYIPSFLEEFRSMKLEMMIRDLHKLNPDELIRVQKEIEHLLNEHEE